jgi:hypothetical protein
LIKVGLFGLKDPIGIGQLGGGPHGASLLLR